MEEASWDRRQVVDTIQAFRPSSCCVRSHRDRKSTTKQIQRTAERREEMMILIMMQEIQARLTTNINRRRNSKRARERRMRTSRRLASESATAHSHEGIDDAETSECRAVGRGEQE
jgi:hypothetical protein